MDKYTQMISNELAKYDLVIADLTEEELSEMLDEAKMISDNPEDKYNILDGYFDNPLPFENIKVRKIMNQQGLDRPDFNNEEHGEDVNKSGETC